MSACDPKQTSSQAVGAIHPQLSSPPTHNPRLAYARSDSITSLPTTDKLQAHLQHANALRDAGRIDPAIACGPGILQAYFEQEQGHENPRAAARTFTDKLYCRMLGVHEHGCPTAASWLPS